MIGLQYQSVVPIPGAKQTEGAYDLAVGISGGQLRLYDASRNAVLLSGRIISGSLRIHVECDDECLVPKVLTADANRLSFGVIVDRPLAYGPVFGGQLNLASSIPIQVTNTTPLVLKPDGSKGVLKLVTPALSLEAAKISFGSGSEPISSDLKSTTSTAITFNIETRDIGLSSPARLRGTNLTTQNGGATVVLPAETVRVTKIHSREFSLTLAANGQWNVAAQELTFDRPEIHVNHYPSHQVKGVSSLSIEQLNGSAEVTRNGFTVRDDRQLSGLITTPFPPEVASVVNSAAPGNVLIPTDDEHVRYIDAAALRLMYETLGIAEDDTAQQHTLYLPVRDGVIYTARPGTIPVKDEGIHEPPAVCVGIEEVTSKVAGEVITHLLHIPVAAATIATGIYVSTFSPVLGVPAAWVVAGVGHAIAVGTGEVAGTLAGNVATEVCEAIVVNPLSNPHSGDAALNKAYANFAMRNAPPLSFPQSAEQRSADGSASMLRRQRLQFIDSEMLKTAKNKAPTPAIKESVESYERILEWNVNQRRVFRKQLNDQQASWTEHQRTKVADFQRASEERNTARAKRVAEVQARDSGMNSQQQAANEAAVRAAIAQMQAVLSSGPTYSSGGGNLSSGAGTFGQTSISSTGRGGMTQGVGCNNLFQPCFQAPSVSYGTKPDVMYIVVPCPSPGKCARPDPDDPKLTGRPR